MLSSQQLDDELLCDTNPRSDVFGKRMSVSASKLETSGDVKGMTIQRMVVIVLGIVLLPVALLVAVIVLLAFGRPLFFSQTRAGLKCAPFTILKFRSMLDLNDESGKPLPDEQRITAVSRLLRRSRLDELPQLLCLARGQMAFVGPRPLLPETIASLGRLGEKRCSVRPGLTGWAQICGNTRLDQRTKTALDIWYIDHRSLLLDLRILWSTLTTVLWGEQRAEDHINTALAYVESNYGTEKASGGKDQ